MTTTKTGREEWRKRIERWHDSGLTAEQFAGELGINAATLKFWKYKLGKESQPLPSNGRRKPATVPRLIELRSEEVFRSSDEASFVLDLGSGRRLRIPAEFEAAALEKLLSVLERTS